MKIFSRAVLALFILFVGCKHDASTDVEHTSSASGSLSFTVDQVKGKATDMTTAGLADFGVYCFRHGAGDWETESATTQPEKMYNQKVVKDGTAWRYDPEQQWEGIAQKLSFFGYSPYATDVNSIHVESPQTAFGVPKLSFEAQPAIQSQIDLLVSRPVLNQRPQGQFVMMQFGHALSKVAILVYPEGDDIFIDAIEFSGIKYKGSFDLNFPAQWVVDPATTSYSIDYPAPGFDLAGATQLNPYDATQNGNYLMTVPQSWVGNSTAKITFHYHTPTSSDLVRNYVLGSATEDWLQGLSTNYLCKLTPVGLSVAEALIQPWTSSEDSQGSFLVNNEFKVRITEPQINMTLVDKAAITIGGVDYEFDVKQTSTSNSLVAELEPFFSWSCDTPFVGEYPFNITRIRLSRDNGISWQNYPYTADVTQRGEVLINVQ